MDVTGKYYHCAAGESFDSVARKLFGKEKYAAELLCVNPELCRMTVFFGGEELRIPEVDIPSEGQERLPETAPWRME